MPGRPRLHEGRAEVGEVRRGSWKVADARCGPTGPGGPRRLIREKPLILFHRSNWSNWSMHFRRTAENERARDRNHERGGAVRFLANLTLKVGPVGPVGPVQANQWFLRSNMTGATWTTATGAQNRTPLSLPQS